MRFVLIYAICVGVPAIQTKDDSKLLSVVVLFRHGDRVPRKFAPLDPYGNSSLWPAEKGELTNLGIQQSYDLGKWLRNRYSDYLPVKYNKRYIYVRSSTVDRCLMSAEANLAGLYPPVGDQIWNNTLLWRPIPVYTLPREEDSIFEMAYSCPKYVETYNQLLDSKYFKDIDASNADFYRYLGDHLGVQISSFTDVTEWYDTMMEEEAKGFKLPDWTKKCYPDEMKKWSDLCYKVPTYNQRLARFATGAFFETISNHFLDVMNSSNQTLASKMILLSGHQTNIADVTNSLGTLRLSPYAGALIFELRRNLQSTTNFVNIHYKANENIEVLKIPNCSVNCDVDEFLKFVEPIKMNRTQVIKECKITIE